MAKINFPKKQEQRLIPKYLLEYAEELQENHSDPSAEWGGGGTPIEAGTGIEITGEETKTISIDDTVALKTDLPKNYVTTDTAQTITGSKTFGSANSRMDLTIENYSGTGRNRLVFKSDVGYIDFFNDGNNLKTRVYEDSNHYYYIQYPRGTISGYSNNTYPLPLSVNGTRANTSGDISIAIPTSTSDLTNDSGYITSSDIPTIPTKTSDLTNDSGFITSSDLPTNYVTTDTTQTITGEKTFTGKVTYEGPSTPGSLRAFIFNGANPIKMYAPSNYTTGFTLFNASNVEKGYLQYNPSQDGIYIGRYSNNSSSPAYAQELGFLSEIAGRTYKLLVPNKTVTDSTVYYIPTEITDGTNTVTATSQGVIDISSLIPTVPTKTSDLTNDSGFITSSALTGYATETYVDTAISGLSIPTKTSDLTNDSGFITGITSTDITTALGYTPGTSNFSGSYNDLTDKPTIPDTSNFVTTNTNQTITSVKTFSGEKLIAFKSPSNEAKATGFTCYDNSNNERANLQFATRTVSGTNDYYLTLGNYSTVSGDKAKVGFRLQPNSSSSSYNFIMPSGSTSDFTSAGYTTSANNYIPCSFTNGTTTVNANSVGKVDISSLLPTVPTNVSSFTNDAGYITANVSTLTNYYDKTYIDNTVGDIETLLQAI